MIRPYPAMLLTLAVSGCSSAPTRAPETHVVPAWSAAAIPSPFTASSSTAKTPTPVKSPYTLEQMLSVKRATAPLALGDGNFVYLYDAPGSSQIFAPSAGAEAPRVLTKTPERIAAMSRVVGKKILFLKDEGGDENEQIYFIDTAGDGPPKALTAKPKFRFSLPVVAIATDAKDEKSGRMAFTSNVRNGKDMDLYVTKIDVVGDTKPLIELTGAFTVGDFRGDTALMVEARSNVDQDLWVMDVRTKKKVLLTAHTGDQRWSQPRFSRDGKAIFAISDAEGEFESVYVIDIASKKRTKVFSTTHDVAQLEVAAPEIANKRDKTAGKKAPTDTLAVVENVDGTEQVLVITCDSKHVMTTSRTIAAAKGVLGSLDIDPSGKTALVSMETATQPPEIFRLDLEAGTTVQLTHSDHMGIDSTALVSPELLTLKASDGVPISTFFYKGKGEGKQPTVLIVHGGPEAQAQPGFGAIAQYLVLSGYSVALPNVRGSTGYGKSFTHLDDKEKREDSVRDLSEIGTFLTKRDDVDGNRLALYGGSYGGYMVLAGLTLYPDQWVAGVDVVGIANFRTFLEKTAPYRVALREAEYGSLSKDGTLLDRISPIHKVDRIKAPLMVIHGARDPRVPLFEATQIVEALKKRGSPVELLSYADEGHGLSKRKNKLDAYPKMIAFMDMYVRDKPAPVGR